jgi:hypothetical protein
VQALLRGRAEGRLELIKGDEKQVRVVGAGARCERRGGRREGGVEACMLWVRSSRGCRAGMTQK